MDAGSYNRFSLGGYSLVFLHLWQGLSTVCGSVTVPELLTKCEIACGDEGLKKDG